MIITFLYFERKGKKTTDLNKKKNKNEKIKPKKKKRSHLIDHVHAEFSVNSLYIDSLFPTRPSFNSSGEKGMGCT